MPIRITHVCDFCDSEEVTAYTVTPDVGKPWRSLLCATHDKQMNRYEAKGTPIAEAVKDRNGHPDWVSSIRGVTREAET